MITLKIFIFYSNYFRDTHILPFNFKRASFKIKMRIVNRKCIQRVKIESRLDHENRSGSDICSLDVRSFKIKGLVLTWITCQLLQKYFSSHVGLYLVRTWIAFHFLFYKNVLVRIRAYKFYKFNCVHFVMA